MITAKDLFDRGYGAEDRDEIQKEFDINGVDLDIICGQLADLNRKRHIKEIYNDYKEEIIILASDFEQIGEMVRTNNNGELNPLDLAEISLVVGYGIAKEEAMRREPTEGKAETKVIIKKADLPEKVHGATGTDDNFYYILINSNDPEER